MTKQQLTVALVLALASTSIACDQARIDQTRADLSIVAQAVALRHTRDDVCPPSLGDLVEADILQATTLLTDEWGGELRLSCAPPSYRASSAGPDGAFGTEDDITVTQILEAKSPDKAGPSLKGSER